MRTGRPREAIRGDVSGRPAGLAESGPADAPRRQGANGPRRRFAGVPTSLNGNATPCRSRKARSSGVRLGRVIPATWTRALNAATRAARSRSSAMSRSACIFASPAISPHDGCLSILSLAPDCKPRQRRRRRANGVLHPDDQGCRPFTELTQQGQPPGRHPHAAYDAPRPRAAVPAGSRPAWTEGTRRRWRDAQATRRARERRPESLPPAPLPMNMGLP